MKKFSTLTGGACAALLALSACTTQADTPAPESSASAASAETVAPVPVATSPAVASEVILDEGDAPAGYTYTDVASVLEAGGDEDDDVIAVLTEISGSTATAPTQCSALLPTAVDILVQLDQDPAGTAGSEFADADGAVISVFATTSDTLERVPEDLGECASFTRASTNEAVDLSITYRTEPLEFEVGDAERMTAARVHSDRDVSEPSTTVIAGEADGVYFHLTAPTTVDDQLVFDLTRAQVDRIIHR